MLQRITHLFNILSLLLVSLLSLSACHHTPDPEEEKIAPRTVLVYMAANCDLGKHGYDTMDIDEMLSGVKKCGLSDADSPGRLIVYHAGFKTSPRLREITAEGIVDLKTYDTDISSIDIARMREVIDDVMTLAPNQSYGLVLWSHATSFREDGGSRSVNLLSYGNDSGYSMKITSLAKALDGYQFDFIYTDVCHMATVEVAYELRHATPYIIGSTTELDLLGMPYHLNVPEFFRTPSANVVQMATNTVEYYREHPRSGCSMSVISTEALDRLADATRVIVASGAELPENYNPVPYYQVYVPCLVYDFGHYIRALCNDPTLLSAWEKAYAETIVYKDAIDPTFGFDMTQYTGLGAYIVKSEYDTFIDGYANQSWYRDVMSHMFDTKNPN